MTAPFVTNIFNRNIVNSGSELNTDFSDLVNYIALRNNGTASWDVLSVSGGSTFNTAITITPTTNQIILGTTRTVTLNAPTPASSSRVHTIPDITGNGTFAFLEGTQTFSGLKTFSSAVTITASSGNVLVVDTNTLIDRKSTRLNSSHRL